MTRNGIEPASRHFWEAGSVPSDPRGSRIDLEARATWSALAESTDPAARYLWLARGPVAALALAREGSVREIAEALEEAAGNAEAERLYVTAAHESMKIRDARAAAERAKAAWMRRTRETENLLERSHERGIRLVRPGDVQWPTGFDDLGVNAPFALWYAGPNTRGASRELECDRAMPPAIALVGARNATQYGKDIAYDFASALAERGVRIVSGGALGIDAAAHSGALAARAERAGGGGTVAFLAGGLDDYYPRSNASLLTRVRGEGGLFSEAPVGARPTRWRFLSRNRLIAAASAATIVIEAAWRSGALSTAAHADALSRSVGAVPGPIRSAESGGCHRLIAERGAQLVARVEDIEAMVGFASRGAAHTPNATTCEPLSLDVELLSPVDRLVYDGIPRFSSVSISELATHCALDPERVKTSLGRIELLGLANVTRGRARRSQGEA